MPRKQNGWGNTKSLSFKGLGRIDIGKKPGAAGSYPSNRQYGTSIQRTVIEKYNLDSDWVKWRKGYEYSVKAVWYPLEEYNKVTQQYDTVDLESKIYQGTAYEIDVSFKGFKFATKYADSNNHYVLKRNPTSTSDLGTITTVLNDQTQYTDQRNNREIWCRGTSGSDSPLFRRMIGDRLTDGETEATLRNVLTSNQLPASYSGKTDTVPTKIKVTVAISDLVKSVGVTNEYQDLVGKICYIPVFFIEKAIGSIGSTVFKDDNYTWTVAVTDSVTSTEIRILDPGQEELPPSLYDISTLPVLYSSSNANFNLTGTYLFDKNKYQKFYDRKYLSAELVEPQITQCSYTVMPFTILGVTQTATTLEFNSVPFNSEFQMSAALGNTPTLIFADWSFTKTRTDNYNGTYYHNQAPEDANLWKLIDTDVDPWMDEVFKSGNPLRIATTYTCSCPNHSQSQLRMPQETQSNGNKINRQLQYPLPSVMGKDDYDALASNKAAGRYTSWESTDHKFSFKMCKHSIAAMFIDKLKIKEPSQIPTIDARINFEEKLAKEMQEVGDRFEVSYRRGGISVIEVVFSLAQGLNLDDTETAYVILNSTS